MKARFIMMAVALGLLLSLDAQAAVENHQNFSSITTTFKHMPTMGAKDKPGFSFKNQPSFGFGHPHVTKAPEISAESAAIGIALLTGIVLLVGERSRARRA